MYMDKSAAVIANALGTLEYGPPNAALLSMLTEATLAFDRVSEPIAQAQRQLRLARDHYLTADARHGDTTAAWQQVEQAARHLAILLRPLGDFRIPRCTRPTGHGTCNIPLDDDGQCRSTLGHLDDHPDSK
jgi:hypothetical protein